MSDDTATSTIEALGFTREPWTARAACRGVGADVFFTEPGEATRPAKAVCAECPVREECLDYALRNGERHGVWGGTSERERRWMRREQGLTGRSGGTNGGRPVVYDSAVVARTACAAHAQGLPIASAVAEVLGIARPNAAVLISRARQRGHEIPYDYRASA